MSDEKFDYLRERSPEQEAASDETEPNPDAGVPGQGPTPADEAGGDVDGERARTPGAGL